MHKLVVVAEPGKPEILMTRLFDAPRNLVFKAMTDPNFIPDWFGPKNLTTIVDKLDFKPGGKWRFVQHDSEGNEFAFNGVYHEIEAPERWVSTFEWEAMPGHILVDTMVLTEQDGKTLMTETMVFQSVEDRDGMLQSGMEGGASESMERIEALLVKLAN